MKKTRKIIAKTACLCGRAEDGKEGKMHRLLVDDKLQLLAPVHNMKVEQALLKLGGTKPRCLQVVEMWHHAAKQDITRRTSRGHHSKTTYFVLPTKLATFYKELVRTRKTARMLAKKKHTDVYQELAALSNKTNEASQLWMAAVKKDLRFLPVASDIIMSLAHEFKMPDEWMKTVTFVSGNYSLSHYYGNQYRVPGASILKTFLKLGPKTMLSQWYKKEPMLVLVASTNDDTYYGLLHNGAVVSKHSPKETNDNSNQ